MNSFRVYNHNACVSLLLTTSLGHLKILDFANLMDVGVWTGLGWLRIETGGVHL
jgi:hypothetical protein